MADLKSVASLTLDLPPSCIQFCPAEPDLFVVGTYFLHRKEQTDTNTEEQRDEPQKRTGSLILFRLESDKITHLHTLPTAFAILDLQFSPRDGTRLAVATSRGSLAFYCISTHPHPELTATRDEHPITDPSILVLSLTHHLTNPHLIGATLSTGTVCLAFDRDYWTIDAEGGDEDIATTTLHSHALEAWTCAFNPFSSPGRILSGGDDAVLRCTQVDTSVSSTDQQLSAPVTVLWEDRRMHAAGVTAILPLSSSLVLSGSYDDRIRLVAIPEMAGRRRTLAEMDLGGGVWRLKVLGMDEDGGQDGESGPTSYTILASCMHAGARIVKLSRHDDDESWSFEVLARFEEHQSMNYGSDVQPDNDGGNSKTILSTSFYDKLLCLWRFGVT